MYFKDSMLRTLNIPHTFENPAFSWPWFVKEFVVTVVNTTAFFFREGVWRHGIFVSRWTENKRNTRISWKSGLIQPVRWRLRHSWSVSRKVCHMQNQNINYNKLKNTYLMSKFENPISQADKQCAGKLRARSVYLGDNGFDGGTERIHNVRWTPVPVALNQSSSKLWL